jgi:hypothetical protein
MRPAVTGERPRTAVNETKTEPRLLSAAGRPRAGWPVPAQLVGIAVPVHPRPRGFGHRLLTGALMLLRAEGFEWVQARAAPGGAGASPLACAGFTADPGTDQADGRTRLVLL